MSFIVNVHLITIVTAVFTDFGGGSRRGSVHVFLSIYVGCEIDEILEIGRRTTWSTMGP